MTSELKCPACPYCNESLHCGAELNVDGHNVEMWCCTNYSCEQSEDLIGTREMWEIVKKHEQSQKDSKVVKLALDWVYKNYYLRAYAKGLVEKAIKQIEQKE
jgi:hypothetical protein